MCLFPIKTIKATSQDKPGSSGAPQLSKLPVTKEQIERLIVGDLQGFAGCENAVAVMVVPLAMVDTAATWTVSCFNAGRSDSEACERALQQIVPHFQRAYDLFSRH